jgi:O-acetylserine/cysteine efflux transporter
VPPLHIAAAVLCTIIWGLNFVAAKFALDDFPPLLFTALRFAFASVPFLIFVKPPDVNWRWVVAIGLFMGVGQFGLLFTGMALGMPPGLSSTMMQTQPFFTILFAIPFLGEKPRWQNVAGIALAFAGVLVTAGNLGGIPLIPFLMVIAAAACWAASNVCTRRAGASDALRLIVWVSAISPLPMLALSWAMEGSTRIETSVAHASTLGWGAVAFTAFVATNIAYGLWSYLFKRYPAATVAPFSLLVPIWGIAAAYVAVGEKLTLGKWIGVALVVAGVAANSWPSRRVQAVAPK